MFSLGRRVHKEARPRERREEGGHRKAQKMRDHEIIHGAGYEEGRHTSRAL